MVRRWTRRRKWFIGLLILALAGGAGWWRIRSAGGAPARFALVRRGTLVIAIKETGTIEPWVKVSLKSKVSGRVMALYVREGDLVRKGQVVALIDPTEIRRQVNQLEADLEAARARLSQARLNWSLERTRVERDIELAYSEMLAARSQWEKVRAGYRPEEIAEAQAEVERMRVLYEEAVREYERQKKLYEAGLIARKQAEEDLRAAEANLQKLLSGGRPEEVAAAVAERIRAQALVQEAQANLKNAKENYERKQRLYEKGFVSRQEVDNAETTYRSAEARLEAALQELEASQQREAMIRRARPEDIAAAQAQVQKARLALETALVTEHKNLDAAASRQQAALKEYQRAQERLRLLKSGSRPEDIRNAEAQFKRAEAAWKRALLRRTEWEALKEEIRVAESQVRRLEEQKANLETQLADTVIRSPIAGVVVRRSVEVGELVASAISAFAQGTEMMLIADLSRLVVKVRLNEVDVAKVQLGQKAEIRLEAIPEKTFTGVITKIAPAALSRMEAAGNPQPGQDSQVSWFDVEILLQESHPHLRLGMSANVDIISERLPNSLLLPIDALMEEDGRTSALVVTDEAIRQKVVQSFLAGRLDELTIPQNRVPTRKVSVRIGRKNEAQVQILSGLTEGDVLLIRPPKRRVFRIQPQESDEEEEQ
ncbi:MAG: HlyD family efflux transporter periplasmic adaptor subunit [Armatimonadetes bacterium]|nr:HlyD family efflux transporter periplasmic adaptor subunit [Armatimonadota bacterium]MDW8122088.1 HlyD family efflux transporter periplasmic adaptor subunit [Armatimonadota bacterium]